ncbi:MAG: hypothetical protein Q7W45_09075 [Bacteroidota bacterium]|nr:hypothetical protein [Bacteroidota bacterium]MDP3144171.1 hypothetical protein [Bacteroidota bacterium]MDP3558276.1 hypothetical protein [Bacteroidota bacterium]
MNKCLLLLAFSLTFAASSFAQDKIKLKSGDIIKSRVLGVTNTEVIYYKIYKLKDPKLKLPKSDVEYIQYENGKIVYMTGKKPAAINKAATTKKTTTTKKKTAVKKK